MPNYDFKCPDGHVTEEHFTFEDVTDSIICPEILNKTGPGDMGPDYCMADAERQLPTGVSFIVNKVMLPPSKRVKNYTLAKPSG